jgi:hypothetical protein
MFLTLFFCLLAGFPCKAVVPDLPPFASAEACIERGYELERQWLAEHREWQESGVRCSAEKPKP